MALVSGICEEHMCMLWMDQSWLQKASERKNQPMPAKGGK